MNFRLLMFRLLGIASVLELVSIQTQAATNFTAINGDWNVAGNWSPATVPNNATTDVVIGTNAAAQVATLTTNMTVRTLQINAGDKLWKSGASSLTVAGNANVATFNTAGTLLVGADGYFQNQNKSINVTAGSVVLNGGGTIQMSQGWFFGNGTIENVNCTISGVGMFGNGENYDGINGAYTINRGRIVADVLATNYLIVASRVGGCWENYGVCEATNGGKLYLAAGYDQHPGDHALKNFGTLSAQNNSHVLVGRVQGGTLTTSGTGTILAGRMVDCTNIGNAVSNGLIGTIVNNATIVAQQGQSTAVYSFQIAGATLTGGGTLTLGGRYLYLQGDSQQVFTNVNNYIIGSATIDTSASSQRYFRIANNGTFGTANAADQIYLTLEKDVGTFVNNGTLLANAGTLIIGASASNAGSLQSAGGTLIIGNAGTCVIDTGLNTGTIGSTTLNGRLIVRGRIATPTLIGTGVAQITSGTINIGKLDIGTLTGTAWGNINSPIASRVKALSLTGGSLSLLSSPLIVDYTSTSPAASIRSQLLAKSLRSDVTGNGVPLAIGYVEASGVGTAEFGSVAVDSTALLLKSTFAGDANLDGTVNSTDFAAIVGSFGAISSAFWWQGDFDYNGKVNTLDYNLLAGNFGQTLPAPSTTLGAVVPEPSTLLLGGTTLIGMSLRRRGKR